MSDTFEQSLNAPLNVDFLTTRQNTPPKFIIQTDQILNVAVIETNRALENQLRSIIQRFYKFSIHFLPSLPLLFVIP